MRGLFADSSYLEAIERAVAQSEAGGGERMVPAPVGTSKALQAALRRIETVAATDATVRIQSETGTGTNVSRAT